MGGSGFVFAPLLCMSVSLRRARPLFVCVRAPGPASNSSTSAQVDGEVILSLPSSACRSAVVFSSSPLFVSAWRPEVKPSVSGSLEFPVPTLLKFHSPDQSRTSAGVGQTTLSFSCFLSTFIGSRCMLF